jgi:hypothetical protein
MAPSTEQEKNQILSQVDSIRRTVLENSQSSAMNGNLGSRLKKILHPVFLEHYKKIVSEFNSGDPSGYHSFKCGEKDCYYGYRSIVEVLRDAALLGMRFEEISPSKHISPKNYFITGKLDDRYFARSVKNSAASAAKFFAELRDSFEYIDFNDLLVQMVDHSSQPWKRYDSGSSLPLQEKWRKASQSQSMQEAHGVLSEDEQRQQDEHNYRGHIVTGAGDQDRTGVFSSECSTGKILCYFRITQHQKEVLEQNPYLTLDIAEDPTRVGPEKTYLVRTTYPNARDYKKVQSELSPELISELQKAEEDGTLEKPQSFGFQELNRKLLKELVSFKSPSDPLKKYQRLISIHPFSDFNGRTFRKLFQKSHGKPLFLTNFDEDLLSTYLELGEKVAVGENKLDRILDGMVKEMKRNPEYPKFYDIPEIWKVASNQENLGPSPAEFIYLFKEFLSQPENKELVRQKRYLELENKIGEFVHTYRSSSANDSQKTDWVKQPIRLLDQLNHDPESFSKKAPCPGL